MYQYVFIGAGPASLAAVGVLAEHGAKHLLVLEAGNALSRRGCPGVARKRCIECAGSSCHVTMGVGGSSAIFGNKLCYFPASNEVLSYFSDIVKVRALRWLDENCPPHLSTHTHAQSEAFQGKRYRSVPYLQADYSRFIELMIGNVANTSLLRSEALVDLIEVKGSHDFLIRLINGDCIRTRNVILGTGRSSHDFLRRVFQSISVDYIDNSQDVGIRLEAMKSNFTAEYAYQEDPKFKYWHPPHGSSRTFCACNDGIVVPVKFGDAFYAEGAFGKDPTGWNNVALLARSVHPLSPIILKDWCLNVNAAAGSRLLLGSIALKQGGDSIIREILRLVPYWPTDGHGFMIREILKNTLLGSSRLLCSQSEDSSFVNVYGPAIDRYWPRPRMRRGLRTSVPGISVIGDAAGLSRGIAQSLFSGAAWALHEIMEEAVSMPRAFHTASESIRGL